MLQPACAVGAWTAEHGGNFSFLIAAHMTFCRVYDDFFNDPAEDSGRLVRTAGRRLADAAFALSEALPVPDATAHRLLVEVLEQVHRMVLLSAHSERTVEVLELKVRTDADLVRLADRLRGPGR